MYSQKNCAASVPISTIHIRMSVSKAVGGTRDRWIEAWIEGEASASTSFFFLNRLVPRTRRGISNFAKTRTWSCQVVFQKLSRSLYRVRGLYRPRPGRPPTKYSCKCGIWRLLQTYGDTSGPEIWGGKSSPPPPVPSCAHIFKCLWGPGIDSKEWIPPAYVARAGIFKESMGARNRGGPPGYIGLRNSFLGIDSWAP